MIEHDRETCDYCQRAQQEPDYPLFRAQCRGCAVRSLAQSPIGSMCKQGLDGFHAAPYRKALGAIFGDNWRQANQLVRAEYDRIRAARALL